MSAASFITGGQSTAVSNQALQQLQLVALQQQHQQIQQQQQHQQVHTAPPTNTYNVTYYDDNSQVLYMQPARARNALYRLSAPIPINNAR